MTSEVIAARQGRAYHQNKTRTKEAPVTRHAKLLLRTVLMIDALTCALCGLVMTLGAGPLSDLTELPPALLGYAGASLFPIAGFMGVVARHALASPMAVGAVIAGNAAWTLASLWLVLSDRVPMNGLGAAFVVAQALVVAVLTALELRGARSLFARPSPNFGSAPLR